MIAMTNDICDTSLYYLNDEFVAGFTGVVAAHPSSSHFLQFMRA